MLGYKNILVMSVFVQCLVGCASGPCMDRGDALPDAAGVSADRAYAFVFIRTGPLGQPTQEQAQQAMQGHFANMRGMADRGELLIAGPLGEPRSDPDHRGLYVFDVRTAGEGLALANTDPAREMGVFTMDPWVLTTDAPLTELPRLEREYEASRLADPNVPDEWVGRSYALASTTYDPALHERVRGAQGVLIAGRLSNARAEDWLLLWLDATRLADARALLPEGDWTLHGWYGSPTISQLPAQPSAQLPAQPPSQPPTQPSAR